MNRNGRSGRIPLTRIIRNHLLFPLPIQPNRLRSRSFARLHPRSDTAGQEFSAELFLFDHRVPVFQHGILRFPCEGNNLPFFLQLEQTDLLLLIKKSVPPKAHPSLSPAAFSPETRCSWNKSRQKEGPSLAAALPQRINTPISLLFLLTACVHTFKRPSGSSMETGWFSLNRSAAFFPDGASISIFRTTRIPAPN